MKRHDAASLACLLIGAAALGGCAVTDARMGRTERTGDATAAAGEVGQGGAIAPGMLPAQWVSVPRSYLKPRQDWFLLQRTYPVGAIPVDALVKAMRQRDLVPEDKSRSHTSASIYHKITESSPFSSVGPAGFTSNVAPAWGAMSGRVRDIAIDPTNASRIFIAAATGGTWRSTDGGATWTALTDTQDTLSTSAVAIDPQNPNTIYAGTGEGPSGAYYGVGLLKSTDGGNTWTVNARSTFARHAIARVLVSPTDSNVVLVCSTSSSHTPGGGIAASSGSVGVFRSTDGGVTFTQTAAGQTCQSLVADPGNFANLYASLAGSGSARDGLYKSTNGGVTFTQLAGGAPTGVSRIALGISADGMTIYGGGKEGDTTRIWKSTDAGATWAALAGAPDYCEKQCDYDNAIAVAPHNANVAFFGGVPLYRTLDGGATFVQLGDNNDSTTRPLHVDHHAFAFAPGSSTTLYNGNDGGLYVTTDAQGTLPAWTSLGGTLATLQPYNVALHPTNASIMLAGFQDNGTELRTGSNLWSERCGGDGGIAMIDHKTPTTMYCSFGAGNIGISKSIDGGVTFAADASVPSKAAGDRAAFIPALAMDPVTSTTLYAGTQRLWRTTDGGASWAVQSASPDLTGGGEATVTMIAIAPSAPATIMVVTSDGLVQRSTDAGVTFVNVTKAPLPGRFATSAAIHPTNPLVAYVGFSGFDDGTPGTPGHLFKTTDGGATWSNVTGNLPDTPVNAIAIRPDAPEEVYAGTDVGTFLTLNGAAPWAKLTVGLPNAGVIDIKANATTNLLAIATYGRSVFTATLKTASPSFEANVQTVVTGFYRTILGREPDAGGLAFWTAEATRVVGLGADVKEVFYAMAMQFFSSAEYVAKNASDAQYITDMYKTFFVRDPSASELGYWQGELTAVQSRSALLNSFLFAQEFSNAMTALFGTTSVRPEVNMTMDLYRGTYGRLPDSAGFNGWLGVIRQAQCQGATQVSTTLNTVLGAFFNSAEYAARARNDRDFMGDVYNAYMRRGPGGDTGGFNFWVGQVPTAGRDGVRAQFVPSAEFQARVAAIVNAGCLP